MRWSKPILMARPHGARQIVVQEIDLVQTSCGFAVPLMDFVAPRDTLNRALEARSEAEIIAKRAKNNMISIDGLPTGLRERQPAG